MSASITKNTTNAAGALAKEIDVLMHAVVETAQVVE
jgi:hypothetical protein